MSRYLLPSSYWLYADKLEKNRLQKPANNTACMKELIPPGLNKRDNTMIGFVQVVIFGEYFDQDQQIGIEGKAGNPLFY